MEKEKRPVMISVLSILNIIAGSLMMLASFGMKTGIEGAALFAGGLFGFIVGIGLFRLCPWARKAAIAGYILNGLMGLAEANIIVLVMASLILAYLFSQGVRDAFSKSGQAQKAAEFIKKENEGIETMGHETMSHHQEVA